VTVSIFQEHHFFGELSLVVCGYAFRSIQQWLIGFSIISTCVALNALDQTS